MTICFGLETLTIICVSNILVESDCLRVINLNDVGVDFSKISLSTNKVKIRDGKLGVVSFSHVQSKCSGALYCT